MSYLQLCKVYLVSGVDVTGCDMNGTGCMDSGTIVTETMHGWWGVSSPGLPDELRQDDGRAGVSGPHLIGGPRGQPANLSSPIPMGEEKPPAQAMDIGFPSPTGVGEGRSRPSEAGQTRVRAWPR